MRWLYTDPQFLSHRTGAHPESPARLERIVEHLRGLPSWSMWEMPTWSPAKVEDLAQVHDLGYVEQVRAFAQSGGGRIEADTVMSGASFDVALLAAGAAVDAVRRVVQGPVGGRACGLIRPPGHHALPQAAMGFCLFNHVAIAATTAVRQFDLNRVLIIDWDVHHGNGTQATFYDDPQVGFLSIHRYPFYPGSGAADETGTGPGLGTTCNVPVAHGTSRTEYQRLFRAALHKMADRMAPELIVVSAGFDAHRLDPIGSLDLEAEDYAWLTADILEVADTYAQGRVVSLLEGGYNLDELPGCVAPHFAGLAEP